MPGQELSPSSSGRTSWGRDTEPLEEEKGGAGPEYGGKQSLLRLSSAAPTLTGLRPRPSSHTRTCPPRPRSPLSCHLCPGHPHIHSWHKKLGEASHLVTVTTKANTKKKKLIVSVETCGNTFQQGVLDSRPCSASHGHEGWSCHGHVNTTLRTQP